MTPAGLLMYLDSIFKVNYSENEDDLPSEYDEVERSYTDFVNSANEMRLIYKKQNGSRLTLYYQLDDPPIMCILDGSQTVAADQTECLEQDLAAKLDPTSSIKPSAMTEPCFRLQNMNSGCVNTNLSNTARWDLLGVLWLSGRYLDFITVTPNNVYFCYGEFHTVVVTKSNSLIKESGVIDFEKYKEYHTLDNLYVYYAKKYYR
jgi:hypothetical protein